MPDEVILIDAYSQIFRAFFAIRMLTNSRGEPTNALFVFTRLLLHIQQTYSTARGAMLFDCGKDTVPLDAAMFLITNIDGYKSASCRRSYILSSCSFVLMS